MNKEFYLYKVISLLIISVFFCNCSKVKNESVKVIQTGSFSNALVIKVNKIGKYCVYIPSDAVRLKFAQLANLKVTSEDSIWEIKLSEISNTIATYKEITKSEDLKIKIEADRNAEYQPIKNLMKCLQDAGYTQPYNLTTKP
ncbi:hypothetical protein [uncultured Prevotellamassilia sp.]|uniref:hypothetical protein n=1 Tax=uncultured Prevotellamassilia sp. TaxID=1926676 RepID=UPI002596ABA8|nr:hypothetical protein [uncultured Prevotellamassilia sp.]